MAAKLYRRSILVDGRRYALGVSLVEAGHLGFWHCRSCELSGGHTLPLKTEDLALQGAEANLMIHHELEHIPRLKRRRQR